MPWLFSSLLVFGAGPARADTPRWEPALLMGHPEESGAIHALALGDVLCDGWPELLVGEIKQAVTVFRAGLVHLKSPCANFMSALLTFQGRIVSYA